MALTQKVNRDSLKVGSGTGPQCANLLVGTYDRTTDHLASTRLVTNATGGVVSRRDFFPFGEQIDDTWGNRQFVKDGNTFTTYNREFGVHQKFTGKERDDESGLDYFGARYLSASLGRWSTPDKPLVDQHLTNPQSWNLYTYTHNSPIPYIDPNGGGGKESFVNWVDRTGFAFTSLVFEPEKTVPRAAGAVWTAVSNPGQTLRGIGMGLEKLADSSFDDQVTVATTFALDVGVAAFTAGASRGTALTELGLTGGRRAALGAFTQVAESMSARSALYQSKITGILSDVNYVVNGVRFDGYVGGVLLDAKAGYSQSVTNGQFAPWFKGADALVQQAQRQVAAAQGNAIQWHFAEKAAAGAARKLLRDRRISGIDVIHTPE